MGLLDNIFNSFKDTVFLKEDSDLEKQVKELKQIKYSGNNSYSIDRDIKLLELGIKDENEIAYDLKNADHNFSNHYNEFRYATIEYLLKDVWLGLKKLNYKGGV